MYIHVYHEREEAQKDEVFIIGPRRLIPQEDSLASLSLSPSLSR